MTKPTFEHAIEDLHLAAVSTSRVLITAPSGETAEDLARALHRLSARTGPLIVLPCGDLESAEIERECGRARNSVEEPTLFMADVERLSARAQQMALATLPTCRGRVLSGTTVDLLEYVNRGQFAAQLFYWLNVIHVQVDRASATRFLSAVLGQP